LVEVGCVNSSGQVRDCSSRLEVVTTVENLGLIGNSTTCNDQITSCLQELSGVDLASWVACLFFCWGLESDFLAELTSGELPQLELVVFTVGTRKDVAVVHIN